VPRLVLVSGPAGVGKSRLGWEFEKYADGLKAQVWWHRGRCLSYGQGVAFWALAEIVRQRLGIAEEDPPETAAGKLAEGLARYVADPAERGYVGVRLGRLLGVAAEGDGGEVLSREELFAGWRVFFERLAAVQPVVLLVEDAQYADAGLLDFLDYLVDWTRDLPVYVLVLAWPELGQARPGFGTGRNRSTLTLDPLDAASMDQMVDALVPGMPAAARAKITAQAQGIPLFAVETIRSLIDRKIVQPVEGVYRLTGEVGQLAVPDSLHALLAARLDALDPQVRRLVADAAVLGATFPAEALIAVSGQDETAVRAALAELVRREVLSVSADRLSPERGSYQFAQNMLRQVAYDTLSRRDRKARHLKVAAHLRAVFLGDGEEVTDVIARHYLDALDAVPDDVDAGQIRSQAITALTRAAERAGRTGAPAQAAASYAAAARLTQVGTADGQPTAAAVLWERAAGAALTNADWPAAVEQAGQAADALSAEALALGQNLAVDDATLAGLFETRGIYLNHAGLRPQAASYFREAARLAGQASDPVRLGIALLNLSDTVTGTDPAAGAEAARAAAAHSRQAGDRHQLATAVANLAQALLMTGDWDTDGAELTHAADADGLADVEFLACYRAWLAALRGEAAAAQAALARLGDQRASDDHQDQALIAVAEAFTAAARRQPAAALRRPRRPGPRRRPRDQPRVLAVGLAASRPRRARPGRHRHHPRPAGHARRLPTGAAGPMQRAERDLARARLAAADPGAGPAFAAAISGLRELRTPYHLAHGLLDHAAHLSHLGDDQAAAAAASQAAGIAARLGCQPLADRADTIQPARPRTAASS